MENDELKNKEKNEVNNNEVKDEVKNEVNSNEASDTSSEAGKAATENVETKNETNDSKAKADAVAEMKEEYKELDDRFKRMLAEFENFKKRTQKEKENIYGMVTGDVLMTMLPIMDNLEKAAEAKTDDTQYQDGVKLV